MRSLKRRNYDRPNIVGAVGQVILGWTFDQFAAFCATFEPKARELYPQVDVVSRGVFTLSVGTQAQGNEAALPAVVNQYGGLSIRLDDSGAQVFIEPEGIRIHLAGKYAGRDTLFRHVKEMTDSIQQSFPDLVARRVSVLFEANISPAGERYQIEDYIVPQFELNDPDMSTFISFEHVVEIDLSPISSFQARGIVRIKTDTQRGGILLVIDVLDDRETGLEAIGDRLALVKDLETHVFESTITDNTRRLFGVID